MSIPNLSAWNVTQEQYDTNDMCLAGSNLYNIANTPYQTIGEPLDRNIYKLKIKKKRDKNPLTLSFWNFAFVMGTASLAPNPTEEFVEKCFSPVKQMTHTSRYVGYAYGGQSSGSLTYLEPQSYGSSSPEQVINLTFAKLQNSMRWYPSQTTQDYNDFFDGMRAVVRINRNKICGVIYVDVCKGFLDGSIFNTSADAYEGYSYQTYTLKEWLDTYQNDYPKILRAYIRWYAGADNNRQLADYSIFSERNYYCDDVSYKWSSPVGPPLGTFVDPEAIHTLSTDSDPYGYMFQTMIFEGFRCMHDGNRTSQTICGITRGLYKYGDVRRGIYLNYGSWMPFVSCYYAGTVDELNEAADLFGLPIATTVYDAQYGDIATDPNIRVPIVDENGEVVDSTTDPDEKEEELEKDLDDIPLDTSEPPDITDGDPEDPTDEDYMPDEDPEEEKEEKDIPLADPQLGTVGVFNRCYAVCAEELQDLADYLWNVDENVFETILKGLALMGQNPMNAIVSIIMYPFNVKDSGTLEDIRIGTVDTEVPGLPMDFSSVKVYDLGSCYCHARYQNYLDYAPYTSISLYVPYVGIISLPTSEFMHKYVTVKLVVDLMTGVGQVVVYAKSNEPDTLNYGLPLVYRNCVIGAQVAVTGQDASTIAGNYIKAITEIASGAMGVKAGNVALSGAEKATDMMKYEGGIIGSWGGIAQGAIDLLTAGNVPVESSGSNSPQCGFFMPQRCALIVHRPKPVDVTDYANLVGYACYDSGPISRFAGYAEFTNIKLDITVATDKEKREIISLLQSGVYV